MIGQAELVFIPCAIATWQQMLVNRNLFVFVDNQSALDSLVKASSPHGTSARFAFAARSLVAAARIGAWYERVPSPSNLADWPSLGQCDQLIAIGAKRIELTIPAELADIVKLL